MMEIFRPAGLSDEDSDSESEDYGFYERAVRRRPPPQNVLRNIEMNLQDAIMNGSVDHVHNIIISDLNSNFNSRLDSGWTPLMHACFHGQDAIVEHLLDRGADPNQHSDSVTPVMVACSNNSATDEAVINTVSLLMQRNCILNIGDKYGQTPLMRAICSGRVELVRKLLDWQVNMEMRDQQGWTALYWAVHHNQVQILELLMSRNARLAEVDKSGRTPLDIAISHDYDHMVAMFNEHLQREMDAEEVNAANNPMQSWHDFYPGLEKGVKPCYLSEIQRLLYGMYCEHLIPRILDIQGMNLRTFLLLEESDMIKLGIQMPYERQRLVTGFRNFHTRGWNIRAVAGLTAQTVPNYEVVDCTTTLATHLQQIYILESTLQYSLREYKKVMDQVKSEPPNSPLRLKFINNSKRIVANINNLREEVKIMKNMLMKINKNNPKPVDLIREKSIEEKAITFAKELLVMGFLGLFVYRAKFLIGKFFKV